MHRRDDAGAVMRHRLIVAVVELVALRRGAVDEGGAEPDRP